MPGMLTPQEKQPSSGPSVPTPPVAPLSDRAPGSGQPSPGEGMSDEQKFEHLRDEAIQLVYGDRFDKLIEMFETNGAEKFPRSVAITINTAIEELEKKYGQTNHKLAAMISADLMTKLIEDIVVKKVLPDVTPEQVQEALPATLQMYADAHDDVSQEDIQQALVVAAEGMGVGGEPQAAAPGPQATNQAPPAGGTPQPGGQM